MDAVGVGGVLGPLVSHARLPQCLHALCQLIALVRASVSGSGCHAVCFSSAGALWWAPSYPYTHRRVYFSSPIFVAVHGSDASMRYERSFLGSAAASAACATATTGWDCRRNVLYAPQKQTCRR